MKKVLIIVDPQVDFISGSMAVKGADECMDGLVDELKNWTKYDTIIITMDSHPEHHMSFIEHGGIWPPHCVMLTEGWEIYKPLSEFINSNKTEIRIVYKGTDPSKEEYSGVDDEMNRMTIDEICKDADRIDIAGIMSEYCVHDTVKGLCEMDSDRPYKRRINLLYDYIATADNHSKLHKLAVEHQLCGTGTHCSC